MPKNIDFMLFETLDSAVFVSSFRVFKLQKSTLLDRPIFLLSEILCLGGVIKPTDSKTKVGQKVRKTRMPND